MPFPMLLRNKTVIGIGIGVVLILAGTALFFGWQQTATTYVRVVDQSVNGATLGSAPGSDIRGIEVQRGQRSAFAEQLVMADIRAGAEDNINEYTDASAALGDPESNEDFVSLGGGELTVLVPMRLKAGDQLTVHEFGAANSRHPDRFMVYVSAAPDGPWQEVGTGSATTTLTVTQ